MTRKLDRTRPFGTVVGGATGASFYQDGHLFTSEGVEVIQGEPAEAAAEAPAPEPVAEPEVTRADLEALHITQIKKLVLENGLEVVTGPGAKAKNIDNLLAAG